MDKYLQYDHFELSEDPSFIRWAKGSISEDDQDWNEWAENNPNKTDIISDAKSLVLAMQFIQDNPPKGAEDKVWNKITDSINTKAKSTEQPKSRNIIKLISYGAVAAIALVLLMINIGSDFDSVTETSFAQIETVLLPDGSEVIVNADSKLQFDKASWNENRLVALEGEAFFSVQKGSKFTVETNSGSVEVLGTSFNVYDRKRIMKVHCETGKVSVRSGKSTTILTPKQSVSVIQSKHTYNKNVADIDRRSTWKTGIFVYKGALLSEVIAELERQLDIRVTIDSSLGNKKFTGSFNKSNVNSALTEVCYPLELKFVINGKNVTITK